MASTKTKIEWTEATWNPGIGCSLVSEGCRNCYAMRQAIRQAGKGRPYEGLVRITPTGPTWTGKVRIVNHAIEAPLHWKQPKLVFVNSMSDLFHQGFPFSFLEKIFDVMNECPRHTFQILTKRSDYLVQVAPKLTWGKNIWMGVSVESAKHIDRIDDLRKVPAHVRFLSLEPLLGPLPNLNLQGIHWVIVGGESGPNFRDMDQQWVRDIRDQCVAAGVKFFFKQWSGIRPKALGRLLDGADWSELP